MALASGTRIGPYEVGTQLGVGGMGEVYRATDTNLKRRVAIKVLPASVAGNTERLARFQREAEVLAALNHPHIAAIYGLEKTPEFTALVMELVDGDDLSQRIAKGAIPVDEALPIAKQIAEALEAAHEHGIIHRDLKPANIKVRTDGTAKVLDFGLAKAMDPEGDAARVFRPADDGGGAGSQDPAFAQASQLATIATPAMTRMGMILGTAAYMSPEQARGKVVDKRTDIWAFGCVLFEMLSGRQLFAGDTLSDTVAAVLTREPDWTMLPASISPGVQRLLARCLERDPRKRLRDIGDARPELEDSGPAMVPGIARERSLPRVLPWALVAAFMLFGGWAFWSRPGSASPGNVSYLDIALPVGPVGLEPISYASQISPDGRTVAVIGVTDGARRLFFRGLDRPDFTEVSGTAGGNTFAFSPDSRSLVFIGGNGELTIVSLADQQQKVLTDGVDLAAGIAWSQAGIVFVRAGALWIVSEDGGEPRPLTVLDAARGELLHDHPLVLPGDRFVLFSSLTAEAGTERIEAVSIDGGSRSVVVERAIGPVWSPTNHLLFSREGAVLAVAFDSETATARGGAVPLLPSGTVGSGLTGGLALSLSSTGTLEYAPVGFKETNVVSVGRDGGELAVGVPSGEYANPRISPDQRRLMVENQRGFIETLDLVRGTRAQLSGRGIATAFSTWTKDGRRIVVRRFNAPFWIAADGSGESAILPRAASNDFPSSPGPDPDSVLVVRIEPETSGDIFLLSLSGAFEPRSLLATPAYDGGPELSPDGRWMLYQSNPSGEAEIFVRRYPEMDRPYPVSAGGGVQARWSRTGREIFYRNGEQMVAVSVDTSGPEPVFGTPTPLFADAYDFGLGVSIPNYDVTPDGRFIMLRRSANGGKLRVVINWTEELKRIMAQGGAR